MTTSPLGFLTVTSKPVSLRIDASATSIEKPPATTVSPASIAAVSRDEFSPPEGVFTFLAKAILPV